MAFLRSILRHYTTMSSTVVTIAKQKVPVLGCASTEEFNKVASFQPFKDWLQAFDKQQKLRQHEMNVHAIHVQSIDYFGSDKIGFVKFKTDISFKETGKKAPGIVFMVKYQGVT